MSYIKLKSDCTLAIDPWGQQQEDTEQETQH